MRHKSETVVGRHEIAVIDMVKLILLRISTSALDHGFERHVTESIVLLAVKNTGGLVPLPEHFAEARDDTVVWNTIALGPSRFVGADGLENSLH